jgi:hypothetical protein
MSLPSKLFAKEILDCLGNNGIPPKTGLQYFTVGLEPYLNVIRDEYFREILTVSSSVKLLVGTYGGGKTHFLYELRDLAWKEGYVVSYVSLSSSETPFHKLDSVYFAIARGLLRPMTEDELRSGEEQGIASFLKFWFEKKKEELSERGLKEPQLSEQLLEASKRFNDYGEPNFTRAIRRAFLALLDNKTEEFESLVAWLQGGDYDRRRYAKLDILRKIDKILAPQLIRSLNKWIRSPEVGYKGLIILFDEAEKVPSLSSKEADLLTQNLREFIDQSKRDTVGTMIFYAVPDEKFLSRKGQVYEALKQRFATYFTLQSPQGSKIELEKMITGDPVEFLVSIGKRVYRIFQIAYSCNIPSDLLDESLTNLAQAAYDLQYAGTGYKRLFMQGTIAGLNRLRAEPNHLISKDEAKQIMSGLAGA